MEESLSSKYLIGETVDFINSRQVGKRSASYILSAAGLKLDNQPMFV